MKRLREAQRRWIRFRDTQCARERSDSEQAGERSKLGSTCIDRLTDLRTEQLLQLLACGAATCAQTWSDSAREESPSSPSLGRTNAAKGEIRFSSQDLLEKWQVTGSWFPDDVRPYAGLSGSASFVLSNIETGERFGTWIDDVALIPEDDWKKIGVLNPDKKNLTTLVAELQQLGPLTLRITPENRAKIITCDTRVEMTTSNSDKCLKFGTAVIDLQDVDFDGDKEFIFRKANAGQRSVDKFEVVKKPNDAKATVGKPLDELDGLTEINFTKKRLTRFESNGACASGYEVYESRPNPRPHMIPLERHQYGVDEEQDCVIRHYRAGRNARTNALEWILTSMEKVN